MPHRNRLPRRTNTLKTLRSRFFFPTDIITTKLDCAEGGTLSWKTLPRVFNYYL